MQPERSTLNISCDQQSSLNKALYVRILSAIVVSLFAMFAVAAAQAQTVTVYGQLGNFDVVNHTGHDAHGFEIEVQGIQPQDIYYTFSVQRYGSPQITSTPTGVLVRWESPYAGGAFTKSTIPRAPGTNFAGSCYQWGANYDVSGCEHFGISLGTTPGKTQYRWLIESDQTPGTLVGFDPPLGIVTPVYNVLPPARVGEPPVLEAVIEAPERAEAPELYGDAQWVKVFKTQLTREVSLDELVSDNAVVPQGASQVEVAWEIVQAEPASGSNGNRRQRRNQGTLNFDTRSVLRRYETYAYTGAYDPATHEALCADTLCNAPGDGELGDYIGAQMAAANVRVASVSVTKTGSGNVTSADRTISCGSKCGAAFDSGTQVTLTAEAGSGSVFAGWGGSCSGTGLTCVLSVTEANSVIANFAASITFSVKTSGKGTVSGPAAGIDCGRTCSAVVPSGTNVTLTATPETGFRFSNWSGACSGTSPTCTVAVNKTSSAQANFIK